MGVHRPPADGAEADSAEAEGKIRVDAEVDWKISNVNFSEVAAHKRLRKFYKHQNRFVDALFEEPVDDKDSTSDCKSRHG